MPGMVPDSGDTGLPGADSVLPSRGRTARRWGPPPTPGTGCSVILGDPDGAAMSARATRGRCGTAGSARGWEGRPPARARSWGQGPPETAEFPARSTPRPPLPASVTATGASLETSRFTGSPEPIPSAAVRDQGPERAAARLRSHSQPSACPAPRAASGTRADFPVSKRS